MTVAFWTQNCLFLKGPLNCFGRKNQFHLLDKEVKVEPSFNQGHLRRDHLEYNSEVAELQGPRSRESLWFEIVVERVFPICVIELFEFLEFSQTKSFRIFLLKLSVIKYYLSQSHHIWFCARICNQSEQGADLECLLYFSRDVWNWK